MIFPYFKLLHELDQCLLLTASKPSLQSAQTTKLGIIAKYTSYMRLSVAGRRSVGRACDERDLTSSVCSIGRLPVSFNNPSARCCLVGVNMT